MKKIVTIAAMCLYFTGFSQLPAISSIYFGNPHKHDEKTVHIYCKLGTDSVQIYGDTMLAVKLLFQRVRTLDSLNAILYEIIGAGVKFANDLPAYYKTKEGNCKWPKYAKELKRAGYTHTYSTKPRIPCSK